MPEDLGKAVLTLEADGSAFSRGLSRAKGEVTGFSSHAGAAFKSVAKAGALAFGAIAVVAGAGIKKAIDAASDMNETISKTQTVFGKSGDAVEAWGATLAETLGISKQAGLDAASMFGTFGTAAGLTGNALAKFSKPLVRAAADLASFHNVPVDQALEDIRSGLAGEVEPLRKYGILLNDAALRQQALKMGLISTTKDALSPQNKMLASQQLILQKLGPAAGDFARTIGSAANQQRIMAAEAANLSAALGQKLLPMKIAILKWVNAHWPEIERVMGAVFTAIQFAIESVVVPALRKIIEIGTAIVGWVQTNWPEISRIAMEVFGAIAPIVENAFNTVKSVVLSAWAIIHGIWVRYGDLILSQLRAVWAVISSTIQNAMTVIRGIVNIIGGLLHGDFSRVWEGIKQVFSGMSAQVVAIFQFFGTSILNALTALGRTMLQVITGPWNAIKTLATDVWNGVVSAVRGAIGTAISAATAVGQGMLRGVSNGLTGLVKMVQGWFQSLWGWIAGAARSAYAFALNVGKDMVQGVIDGIKHAAQRLWDAAGGLIDGAKKKLEFWKSPPGDYGKWLGTELVTGIVAALKGGASAVGGAAGDLVTSAKGPLLKGMNSVGQMIIAAAKKYGIDARAALAVAMTEGRIKFGAVGDSGHSFGPFQMADFGALSHMTSAAAKVFANSYAGVDYALRKMAESGSRGLTGLAAIKQIVGGPGWGFERPLNAANSVAKAWGYFKQLGPEVASAVAKSGTAISGSVTSQLTGLANLVKRYAPIIGLEQARGVVAGLVQGQPTLLQQAKAGMIAAVAAQKQAVVDARGAFVSAFNTLATAALAAFDAKMSAWKPPSLRLLDKMQLEDQAKQGAEALASAMAQVAGGGAAAAQDLAKGLSESIGGAMQTAFGQIAGAKTEAALNAVSQTAQQQVTAAITAAASTATAQAQTAVDTARAALATAQAGGDPEVIAAAQAALDTAVTNQVTLENAVRAEVERNTGLLVTAEQTRHDQIAAKMREGMAKRLEEQKQKLLDDPKQWDTMGASVQKILADYNVKLQNAGTAWANKFGDGIRAGIPAAVAQARALAAAVAAVLPSTSSPLKPAKEGPLAFHPYDMGRAWASSFGGGLAAGRIGNLIERGLPSFAPSRAFPSGGRAADSASPTGDVILQVSGREIGRIAIDQILREQGRTAAVRLAT